MAGKDRSRLRWGPVIFLWWVICLAAAAVVAVPVIYQLRYADRIYEGVRVSGIPLGGLTVDEAAIAIRDGFTPYRGAPVTMRYGTRSWSFSLADLGVSVDARAIAAEAYAVGRREQAAGFSPASLLGNLAVQWQAWRFSYDLPSASLLNENRLALTLKQIAREIDQPPREGALNTTGANVTGTPGADGWLLDQDSARANVLDLLRSGKGGVVSLVTEQRQPAITSVDAAVAKANVLLGQSVTLVAEGAGGIHRSAVDRSMLRSWLRLSPSVAADGSLDLAVQVDDAKIRPLLQDLAKQLDKPVQNAALDWDTTAKQAVVLQPSQPGQALDVEGATDAISKTLMSLAAAPLRSPAAPTDSVSITLPVTIVTPTIDSSRITDLGIKELVTQGTTYFAGSAAERVHNIVNAAEKFRGTVVPPGQEFSFNKIVGDVSTANGFVDSLIIRGDRTEVGVGGGVCQVSTTAFRAAVQGGFPIIERHTHSYVVSWYGEPGLDATIYTPYVDFRFKNDTNAFLLIKPEVDTAKGRITFSLYGTRPERTVELSKPEITNVQEPEPPIYQEDGSLPRGTIKQVDWAKNGEDVVVKRLIRGGDGKVVEEQIVSKYEPWRSVFLYGPGAKLPADALIGSPVPPSPTPTATPKATP